MNIKYYSLKLFRLPMYKFMSSVPWYYDIINLATEQQRSTIDNPNMQVTSHKHDALSLHG